MTFGFIHLSIVPLRKQPSDTSQQVTQLLFGDVVEILDTTAPNRVLVRNGYDEYEGYMDPKQLLPIDSIDYFRFLNMKFTNHEPTTILTNRGLMLLPSGCSFPGNYFDVDGWNFKIPDVLKSIDNVDFGEIVGLAKSYLNAPYLWGGKTQFGIDCSGFTQTIYKFCGLKIRRDAWQQAEQGDFLNFIEETRPGDLAFFDNEEGRIIHVGMIISPTEIIHASGCVRIDKLDHQGIFNTDTLKYSHQLRLLKRYF
jgi:hypothetical protein